MKHFIKNLTSDIGHLFYPKYCVVCQLEITQASIPICNFCHQQLPFTHFENYQNDTVLDERFHGRIQLDLAYALFYFEKGKSSQAILHAIKYGNQPEIGYAYGVFLADKLKTLIQSKQIDALVPVPMHPKKEFIRGYNQSKELARGIADRLNLPILEDAVAKIKQTKTQTKHSKLKRLVNVNQVFKWSTKSISNYKHLAIIDDVVTTGSTLESLIRSFQENYPEIRISIICLAYAK